MTRPYYTLAARAHGVWFPQFGDYDREIVEAELQDYRDHGRRARDLKIVRSQDARKVSVEMALAKLNGWIGK
jgi:hypothetical protein